jgi:hypothetical protein
MPDIKLAVLFIAEQKFSIMTAMSNMITPIVYPTSFSSRHNKNPSFNNLHLIFLNEDSILK